MNKEELGEDAFIEDMELTLRRYYREKISTKTIVRILEDTREKAIEWSSSQALTNDEQGEKDDVRD